MKKLAVSRIFSHNYFARSLSTSSAPAWPSCFFKNSIRSLASSSFFFSASHSSFFGSIFFCSFSFSRLSFSICSSFSNRTMSQLFIQDCNGLFISVHFLFPFCYGVAVKLLLKPFIKPLLFFVLFNEFFFRLRLFFCIVCVSGKKGTVTAWN